MKHLIEARQTLFGHIVRPLLGAILLTAVLFTTTYTVKAAGTLIPAASRVDMVYDSGRDVLYITNGDSVLRYHISSDSFMTPFVVPGANLGGIDLSHTINDSIELE